MRLTISKSLYSSQFRDYATASSALRARLGVARLTPSLAAEVRAAVERHCVRAQVRPSSDPLANGQRRRETTRDAAVSAAVWPHADACFRSAQSRWAGGETTTHVHVSRAPRASGRTEKVWSDNGKWSGANVIRSLNVTPGWRRHVEARGLANLDGMLTTHAELIATEGDVEVYRASWVRQGRGYDLVAESGEIAYHRPSGEAYHAQAGKSLAGLRRKLRAQAIPAEERDALRTDRARAREAQRSAQLARLAARIASWDLDEIADVDVTLADSHRAGNCAPGTQAFRDRYFPGRESTTIGEIGQAIAGIRGAILSPSDLTLARQVAAACLIAIRRRQRARRLATA